MARPQRLRSLNGSDFGWHALTALRKGVASGEKNTAFTEPQTVPPARNRLDRQGTASLRGRGLG